MRALSFALLAALLGCSETGWVSPDGAAPPDGLALTTDRSAYAPGATATVTFRNGTSRTVSLAQPLACARVEREGPDGWSPAPSDMVCAAVLVPVEAGGTATVEMAAPATAGTYRLSQKVYPGEGDGWDVTSPAFRVR